MAVNLLEREQSTKCSIRGKRLKAGWDEDYLAQVLCSNQDAIALRQDLAREPMAWPPVVHTRCLEFDWACSQTDGARLGFSVANHECVTLLVTQMTEFLNVLFNFQFQCNLDHAPCPFSGQLVQRVHDLRNLPFNGICGTLSAALGRGSQYASAEYQAVLESGKMVASMSRSGNCYDNAAMESFFGTLKCELIHDRCYRTHAEARQDIFEYIEVFYNRQRLHSALGYKSPATCEQQHQVA
jgi:hypothetical protein